MSFPLRAQWRWGLQFGPSIQSLRVVEGTVTEGYKPKMLAEAGFMLAYDIGPKMSVYQSTHVLERGAKLRSYPTLGHAYQQYWIHVRTQFLEMRLGIQGFAPVHRGLALAGDIGFAYGLLTGVNTVDLEDGKVVTRSNGKAGFYEDYAGLNVGVGLNYEFHGGIRMFFLPSLQVQLNKALVSNTFVYKYGGLVFRVGATFPAKKKIRK